MGEMASQITSLTIVYSSVHSGADQRKHQSSASLAFVRGIHRSPVNSPHKWPVARKIFPFDDVIMMLTRICDDIWCHCAANKQHNLVLFYSTHHKIATVDSIWDFQIQLVEFNSIIEAYYAFASPHFLMSSDIVFRKYCQSANHVNPLITLLRSRTILMHFHGEFVMIHIMMFKYWNCRLIVNRSGAQSVLQILFVGFMSCVLRHF